MDKSGPRMGILTCMFKFMQPVLHTNALSLCIYTMVFMYGHGKSFYLLWTLACVHCELCNYILLCVHNGPPVWMFVTCDVGDAMTIVHKSFYDLWDGDAAVAEETSAPCRDITVWQIQPFWGHLYARPSRNLVHFITWQYCPHWQTFWAARSC